MQSNDGGKYLLQIEAAIRFGERPSAIMLGRKNRGGLDKWDYLIMEAYEIVQRERCPQCGLPVWVCHSEDNSVGFVIEKDHCAAIEKKEQFENPKTGKKPDLKPGTSIRPVPKMAPGRDLVELREPYYKTEYEKKHAPEIAS